MWLHLLLSKNTYARHNVFGRHDSTALHSPDGCLCWRLSTRSSTTSSFSTSLPCCISTGLRTSSKCNGSLSQKGLANVWQNVCQVLMKLRVTLAKRRQKFGKIIWLSSLVPFHPSFLLLLSLKGRMARRRAPSWNSDGKEISKTSREHSWEWQSETGWKVDRMLCVLEKRRSCWIFVPLSTTRMASRCRLSTASRSVCEAHDHFCCIFRAPKNSDFPGSIGNISQNLRQPQYR